MARIPTAPSSTQAWRTLATPNCADAIDNDGDGKKDAADTDCLVGDNLGGGNTIAAPNACGLDPKFFAAKNSPTGLTRIDI